MRLSAAAERFARLRGTEPTPEAGQNRVPTLALRVRTAFSRSRAIRGRASPVGWSSFIALDPHATSGGGLGLSRSIKRITPIIPSRADQPETPDFDRAAYRGRNLIERLVGKLKQFRRVATRYDRRDAHYLTFVQLASATVWLRSFGDTP